MPKSLRVTATVAIASLALLAGGCTTIQLSAANFVERDIAPRFEVAYGDDARQRYDVYRALDTLGKPLTTGTHPVVVFVHGGSWESGSKALYEWMGQSLAKQGVLAIVPNYGLMPERRFPGFVEDVAAAVAHARARVAGWGGDTTHFVLMGHSAGAHIASLVAFDAKYLAAHGRTPDMLSGFAGLSGPYDFIYDTPLLRRTFAGTPDQERAAQPIAFVTPAAPRTLLVMGREDTTVNPRNTVSLAARMRAIGAPVEELWVSGTHGVTVGAFARIYRTDNPIVERVLRFVRGE
jgi:acetyl esterase/lipase